MAETKYETELARAQNDKHSKPLTKLSGSVRLLGLNNLKSGDVVTIPAGYKSFEQEIPGSTYTAEYIIVNVKRGVQELALRFYPSSFFKMGRTVNKTGDEYTLGEFTYAKGNVVNAVQEHSSVATAVDALVNKPFRVELTPTLLLKYESRDKEEGLTKDDVNSTNMPIYEFV